MGTQQVSSNVIDVHCGTASSQVLSEAQKLSGGNSRLKLELTKFLDAVRAA